MTSKDVMAQTDLALDNVSNNYYAGYYFVAAHHELARFYSDPIRDFENAKSLYNKFIDLLKYFEGGTCELYQITEDDYNVVSYIRI